MISIEKAREILFPLIQSDAKHQDWQHVVDLADQYEKLITGKDISTLLQQFVPRETPELFEQRKRMTQAITPAIASTLMNPAYKVPRIRPVVNKIDFDKQDDKGKVKSSIQKINYTLSKYWGEVSLDEFMEKRIIDSMYTDPNSFIVTLFNNPKERFGSAIPYPVEISSREAWNFEYLNNKLQWLLTKNDIPAAPYTAEGGSVNSDDLTKSWALYYFYTSEIIYTMQQVDARKFAGVIFEEGVLTDVVHEGKTIKVIKLDKVRAFIYTEYTIKAGEVPAVRIGYKRDLTTKGRTFVNPFHAALTYFMKSIKVVSEFDLSASLHVFLQKLAYQPKCRGESKSLTCDRGWRSDGATCNACKGSGYQIHTSAQDSIIMGMPSDKDNMIDLEKLVHYVNIPIDIVKFQDEYIDKLEAKAIKAVYNSELFNKDQIVGTATEKQIDLESVYDTLFPLAKQYATIRTSIVRVVSNYISLGDGLIVEYVFPKDFKFKPVSVLLVELNQANTGGGSAFVREEINNDLAEQLYIDKPDMLARLRTKKMFDPFDGKTSEEIRNLLTDDDVLREDKVLWKNFKRIFIELERESIAGVKKNPGAGTDGEKSADKIWFYDLPEEEQRKRVDEKVQALIILLDAQAPAIAGGFDPSGLNNLDLKPEGGTGTGDNAGTDNIGKIPLAIQQLTLAKSRAAEAGDTERVNAIGAKIDELLAKLN